MTIRQTGNEFAMILGDKVRILRKNTKLTMDDFAEKAGISVRSLSNIENGYNIMSIETLIKISNIEEIDMNLLELFEALIISVHIEIDQRRNK